MNKLEDKINSVTKILSDAAKYVKEKIIIHNYLVISKNIKTSTEFSLVVRAKNKSEAIERFNECKPGYIVLDVKFLD